MRDGIIVEVEADVGRKGVQVDRVRATNENCATSASRKVEPRWLHGLPRQRRSCVMHYLTIGSTIDPPTSPLKRLCSATSSFSVRLAMQSAARRALEVFSWSS